MKKFDKLLFSRKFNLVLFLISIIGLKQAAQMDNQFNGFILLLMLGAFASLFTIVVKTYLSNTPK